MDSWYPYCRWITPKEEISVSPRARRSTEPLSSRCRSPRKTLSSDELGLFAFPTFPAAASTWSPSGVDSSEQDAWISRQAGIEATKEMIPSQRYGRTQGPRLAEFTVPRR